MDALLPGEACVGWRRSIYGNLRIIASIDTKMRLITKDYFSGGLPDTANHSYRTTDVIMAINFQLAGQLKLVGVQVQIPTQNSPI